MHPRTVRLTATTSAPQLAPVGKHELAGTLISPWTHTSVSSPEISERLENVASFVHCAAHQANPTRAVDSALLATTGASGAILTIGVR